MWMLYNYSNNCIPTILFPKIESEMSIITKNNTHILYHITLIDDLIELRRILLFSHYNI